MKEIVKQIIEVENIKVNDSDWQNFDGYKVITSDQEILLLIDMETCCCESPGYFWSDDDFSRFIGSELLNIEVVDTELNKEKLDKEIGYGLDEGGIMFVNLVTNKGILQFAAYNSHNGYYGHTGRVVSKQLNLETGL